MRKVAGCGRLSQLGPPGFGSDRREYFASPRVGNRAGKETPNHLGRIHSPLALRQHGSGGVDHVWNLEEIVKPATLALLRWEIGFRKDQATRQPEAEDCGEQADVETIGTQSD